MIPVGLKAKNSAWLDVEQREWRYRKGNDSGNVTMESCVPWEEISRKAVNCLNKCLPVIAQYLWKEKVDIPRCQTLMDQECMFTSISKV